MKLGGAGAGERALGMDNHGSQRTHTFQSRMDDLDIVGLYTPVDCTDVVAPVDHHVGARLKKCVAALYHYEFEQNRDKWCNPPQFGGLEEWERRVYMATWVSAAWSLIKPDGDFFRSAFVSTGFLLAKDGSDNHLIKIPGVENYQF
jgi:hypothetical protein